MKGMGWKGGSERKRGEEDGTQLSLDGNRRRCPSLVGMHDEIFHFEMFKKFHENFEIRNLFQDPFFEIFHDIFNFHYKVT